MKRILITGANRGLGLELTRQYAEQGNRVFAACRNPDNADDLRTLVAANPGRVTVVRLDVADEASIGESYQVVQGQVAALDLLINNAGILIATEQTFADTKAADMMRLYRVNVVGPVLVTQRYIDLLQAGKSPVIVNVSSEAGSITRRTVKVRTSYAASKAALNMVTRMMANNFTSDGITAISIHPGWVRTDMGGPSAHLAPEEATANIISVIDGLTIADSGHFLRWDGEELPW
jgi:NAD(P)-dependent dehydrogenase (short-subunit alcohol dehydrogenase family)